MKLRKNNGDYKRSSYPKFDTITKAAIDQRQTMEYFYLLNQLPHHELMAAREGKRKLRGIPQCFSVSDTGIHFFPVPDKGYTVILETILAGRI